MNQTSQEQNVGKQDVGQGDQTEAPAKKRLSTFSLLALVTLGMVAIQAARLIFPRNFGPPRYVMDAISLQETALPPTIGPWQQQAFTRPDVTRKQKFHSHTWQYSADAVNARVSLDQASWRGWHELPVCYHVQEWQIQKRTVHLEPDSNWPYVKAQMFQEPNLHATLLFSLFEDNGQPLTPPDFSPEKINGMTPLDERFMGRIFGDQSGTQGEVYQCQLFYVGYQTADEPTQTQLQTLHQQTRQLLLKQVVNQTQSPE